MKNTHCLVNRFEALPGDELLIGRGDGRKGEFIRIDRIIKLPDEIVAVLSDGSRRKLLEYRKYTVSREKETQHAP